MPTNGELHGRMDEALNSGDLETARGLMAEDYEGHFSGQNPFAGDYQGRDAFFEVFQRINEETGGNFSVEHREVLSSDEHSVALSRMSATRDGQQFEGDVADICRWKDGRVVEEWILAFDQQTFDAFWS